MSKVTTYVQGPINGVSQLPPQDRLLDSCEDMQDCMVDLHGLRRRPPFQLLKQLLKSDGVTPITVASKALLQEIPMGSPSTDVTLLLNAESTSVVPYLFYSSSMTPIAITVTSAAQTYLNSANGYQNPNNNFAACSIEDYTFIANRNVEVVNGSDTAPTRPHEAMIWVKTGQYARIYRVILTSTALSAIGGSINVWYQPSTGGSAVDANGVGTDVICNALYTGTLLTSGEAGGVQGGATPTGVYIDNLSTYGFTTSYDSGGSVIYISHPTIDFTLTISDDQGGTAMVGIKDSVQAFSDLPLVGINGFVIEIAQEGAGGASNYWVQFEAQATTSGGIWNECISPGAPYGVEISTLPVAITYNESTGVWTCDVVSWGRRTVGDLTTVPDPGFIGDYITDVSWFKGRLLLLYNDGCVLSASDSPFKLYTTTLAAALDSDPVGFLSPAARKTYFKRALNFDQRMFLFSDRVQAAINSYSGVISDTAAYIVELAQAAYADNGARPQQGNHKVYFLVDRTSSSIVYNLAIDRLSGLALEDDVSVAVAQYIPNGIDRAATWEADYITVYGVSGGTKLYFHVYREEQYQRVQNAYYLWNTPPGFTLGGFYFKYGILHLVLIDSTSGYAYMTLADTTPDQVLQGTDSNVSTVQQALDFMSSDAQWTLAYSAATNETTCTAPFTNDSGNPWVVSTRAPTSNNGGYPEAYLPDIVSQTTTQVILEGDWVGQPLWFGFAFTSQMTPSQWYVRGQDQKPMHDGRLSIKHLKLDIARLGALQVTVNSKGRASRTTTYSGYNLDDLGTPIGSPPNQETATLLVPISANSKDVSVQFTSSSHLGFKLLGYEWTGDWNPRSRRLT